MFDFSLLNLLILLPMAGAAAVALAPAGNDKVVKALGLGASLVVGLASLAVLVSFDAAEGGYQMVVDRWWVQSLGISWKLGVDGISLFLIVLTGVLFPIAIAGPEVHHNRKGYVAWMLVLEAGCMGVFLALDLFVFFLFWELVLVPMYFLIGGWGYDRRIYATLKFFLYTMVGSALMFVAILSLVLLSRRASGVLTFDLEALATGPALASTTARWLFCAFALSFAIKVPVFPVHTWLPDAHTEAPTGGSVILAGVMLKLGTYAFIRFGLYLFPQAAVDLAPWLLTLGTIGIIYGARGPTVQKYLKRLVAYSSVAHLGFIVIGIFGLSTQGLEGGVLQMVNHGISTGALFLLVGMIYERRHTRQIAELGGIQKVAPVFAGVFTLVMLSSIGLPGLNGFVGEFLILIGTFVTHRWWAVVATVGVILAALYLLWAYQRVFHGEPHGDNAHFAEMTGRERLIMAPLLVLIVALGVYPKPVLDRIAPAVALLVSHVEERSDYRQPVIEVVAPTTPPTGDHGPAGSTGDVEDDDHGVGNSEGHGEVEP
ncbi:MAG: complex I subunit 4 family protein [Acidimicrobiales bacterium]